MNSIEFSLSRWSDSIVLLPYFTIRSLILFISKMIGIEMEIENTDSTII